MKLIITLFWLALTVYHEARGESAAGQKAVVKVILNRSRKAGKTVAEIVTARKQFSCFNGGAIEKNPDVWIKDVQSFRLVMEQVKDGYDEWVAGDTLEGATHYYALKGMAGGKPPYWAAGMTFVAEVGNHKFLREG